MATEDAKSQAESIAKTMAAGQVVANQVAVLPAGSEKIAKTVNSRTSIKGLRKIWMLC